ncbi:MAG TPA: sodium:proton antiporter [Arenibaculum sp.]|nr:sodium:proton antiporter [Arenibaculum sp.]
MTGTTMTGTTALFGLCGALLVGIGLYGMLTRPALLRKIVAFNVTGSGIFLLLGSIAGRGPEPGPGTDPVPQAMVITGIVVALSTTALALGLAWRHRRETGRTTLPDESEG